MTVDIAEISDTVQEDRILSGTLNSNRGQESNTCPVLVLNVGGARWVVDKSSYSWISIDPLKIVIHSVPFDENRILVRREMQVLHAVKTECSEYFIAEFDDLEMELRGRVRRWPLLGEIYGRIEGCI